MKNATTKKAIRRLITLAIAGAVKKIGITRPSRKTIKAVDKVSKTLSRRLKAEIQQLGRVKPTTKAPKQKRKVK